jgi:hypothetical protein
MKWVHDFLEHYLALTGFRTRVLLRFPRPVPGPACAQLTGARARNRARMDSNEHTKL